MRGAVTTGTVLAGWLMLWPHQGPMAEGEYKGIHEGRHGAVEQEGPSEGRAPIRVTMEELHQLGGVPNGWRFTIPSGDPEAGREAFVQMECYRCHAVQGEKFPTVETKPGDVGPDLTGMGAHHPAEYLADSILNPNSVIILGEGFTGSDGLSKMPSYNDLLTVKQLLDLVAYLKTLTAKEEAAPAHHRH